MAKGRRLASSRSERLLGSYGHGYGYGADGSEAAEFDEDAVWSTVDHGGADRGEDGMENSQLGCTPEEGGGGGGGGGGSGGGRRGRGRVPRGGLSLAFEDSGVRPSSRIVHQFRGNDAGVASSSPRGHGHHHMATSAPVNVPDWSKIYRVDSVESMHDSDDGLEERGSEMVPPHEYLAREYARSQQAAATSVFEGVGRTLKGRDMRRMRDAVWSQTGFDG